MLVLVCSFFVLLLSAPGGWALRMRNFEVPLHVYRGNSTVLKCEFDLQGERLYSVKWYKGGREFFRYVPNERPMKQDYVVQGVKVDMEASTGQQVVLKSATLATSGRYKCEVLAEAPAFNTLVEHAILTVVDIPQEKPTVLGARERYQPGDVVSINCTSAPSKPAATLTWYINGAEAPRRYLREFSPYMQSDGLEQSTLGLHFLANHDHFPHKLMSLRCTASIGIFYNETEVASMEPLQRPALSLESREHLYGSMSAPLISASASLPLAVVVGCILGVLR
ncbi:cell adhesion molecule 3-like [Macrobrachium rosenbergii]|uniref:cell adhesion molecule 3-like n=1 Tax=Macrobrachium rosenbergii TaxID=79674 RepID=UPI0034D6F55B